MRLRRFSVKRARMHPPSPFGKISGGMSSVLSFRCGARDHLRYRSRTGQTSMSREASSRPEAG
jgi:hypothetical protein